MAVVEGMVATNYTFVANWKMYLSYTEEINLFKKINEELGQLPHKLIICPSFISIATCQSFLTANQISLGAQLCSNHPNGAFTGQISAKSLAQLGCTHVIVGHSEQRLAGTHDQIIADQVKLIVENKMIPIICIGETETDISFENIIQIIQQQLSLIKSMLIPSKNTFYIAYEPVWSIGTGTIPALSIVQNIFSWLKKNFPECLYFYGGSVNEEIIRDFASVTEISGFLIGSASIDFQRLKKIVS